MKIYLFCSAGMSTSLLVNKMVASAKERNIDAEIAAFAESLAPTKGVDADVVLLGPQIRYREKQIKEQLPTKPVMVIDMRDYGTMNGAKVLDSALKLFEETK